MTGGAPGDEYGGHTAAAAAGACGVHRGDDHRLPGVHGCWRSISLAEPGTYASEAEWASRKAISPVRVQWDPERSLSLGPLDHRAIQVGLSGAAVTRYVDDWIAGVSDVTGTAREIADLVQTGDIDAARHRCPRENPYPLPGDIARAIGASGRE